MTLVELAELLETSEAGGGTRRNAERAGFGLVCTKVTVVAGHEGPRASPG